MKLLSPINIGNVQLKHRIIMVAMGPELGDFNERTNDYYIRRAEGGASMIMVNVIATEKYDGRGPSSVLNQNSFQGFKDLVDECHGYNCKVCLQIMPGVGLGQKAENRTHPTSASRTPISHDSNILFDELSLEEIKDIQDEVLRTGLLAKEAGADIIEIHAYGGYLTDRFMTPIWNVRKDEYGGSFENRMRFLTEIIKTLQDGLGKNFPLLVKFTPTHLLPEEDGYRGMDEGVRIAKTLEDLGVHGLHVDVGCHDNWYTAMPPIYQQEPVPQLLASQMIKEVTKLPVISNGRLGDSGKAETALKEGFIDIAGVGRQFLADPSFPNKIIHNNSDEIRYCIYCNEGCIKSVTEGRIIDCAVNPITGSEKEKKLKLTENPKKILVIGGGPAGCTAAIVARQCGHDVSLWEKENQLGGNFLNACMPPFKRDGNRILDYYKTMVDKLHIDTRFNKEATKDLLLNTKADIFINATGGNPIRPGSIAGIYGPNVALATDVLQNRIGLGDRVAIVGGGLVGCETALVLANLGKKVSLIEMADGILPEPIWIQNHMMLTQMMDHKNISIKTSTRLVEVARSSIVVLTGKKEKIIHCDNVVLAMGFTPNDNFYQDLKDEINIINVGDSVSARKVIDAVHEAYDAVINI